MKEELLDILECPRCGERLRLQTFDKHAGEIRGGLLVCLGEGAHDYEVRDGIARFEAGFNNEAVQREIEYENSSYHGSELLTDPTFVGQFPDSLPRLWPHLRHFGPDFRAMINQFRIRADDWILDVGTGPCWSSRLLAERSARVVALDVNDAPFYGLRTADMLFQQHGVYFERVLESMTHLPFRSESFHLVTFNASFHHTPDLVETLGQCFRVLKPGGTVAMVNESFVSIRQKLLPKKDAHTETDLGSHHDVDYSEFERTARGFGFEVEYQVAEHIRHQLRDMMTYAIGNAAISLMEKFPICIKQLYSALVLLRKPGRLQRTGDAWKEQARISSREFNLQPCH
jgi:ubiquinone/menaquinone biosynthesis C-methylase UbiE/uncharacterized protein YbaR (Trm112 family)